MAAARLLCGLALLLCCTLGVRGRKETSCKDVCDATYPLHTYPEAEELFACHRGCRLFTIILFSIEEDDLNKTRTACESACKEAHCKTSELYGCFLGCLTQMPIAEKRLVELADMLPQIRIIYPSVMAAAFWDEVMYLTHSFVYSSLTFFIATDNGQVFVMQTPEIQQIPPLQPEDESEQVTGLDEDPSALLRENPYDESLLSQRAGILDLDGGEGIMKCFSMNSNWLLTATLLLSILVLLWICCATVATASDQYIPPEKLSIYGDLEYVNEQKLHKYPSASLVVIHGFPQENEEAGPLPTKVDLAKSAI